MEAVFRYAHFFAVGDRHLTSRRLLYRVRDAFERLDLPNLPVRLTGQAGRPQRRIRPTSGPAPRPEECEAAGSLRGTACRPSLAFRHRPLLDRRPLLFVAQLDGEREQFMKASAPLPSAHHLRIQQRQPPGS